ncbi:MAG: methylenetetrahydrofolate reductase [NAD(P)H] [Nitrospinaceae bacterium]|nr:methylenetetrahydrofolate reductase [NAD(P)H] [Nitrospinaceae bacterium]NIS86894.1 methylenetetrahydrofolate reductase [NAD(P)H] [Nitrospinaceae bacterium]NIT83731.1 methylenetetrahydrofolate reductase [NAD(P)H] [Nitrospinaceae bacterium]NIU45933.1 methylenetetrahydrofolate reductase [NAD(P)H] [Nitrospinaceae bacterium]NIU98093.1 methylenetetrahydrofolate reductase [NAD(P)H] [Nitrospinaceae bacterium]
MRIRDMISQKDPFLSLEFFPPKEESDQENFFARVEKMKTLSPLFASITCGAGGSTPERTLETASRLQNGLGLETMAHLTCLGGERESVEASLAQLQSASVNNVLALRGDPPKDEPDFCPHDGEFLYASDLVEFVRERFPDMGIGVAGYPEAHPDSPTVSSDLHHVKEKLDRGADFLITQFLFDNRIYFDFVERLQKMGVNKPIIPGVLPVLSLRSVRHILNISGASIPGRFYLELEEANERGGAEEVRKLGIDFAQRQIRDLLEGGAPGIHLYTLNQSGPTLKIAEALS